VHDIILKSQDDDNTNREISEIECEDPGESTLLSLIEEDNMGSQQEVLDLDQVHHDMTTQTTRVPAPQTQSRADTLIDHTSLPNLRHSAGATAPPLLERQKSTINI